MRNFILTTETTCDLSKEYLEEKDIPSISLHYYVNEKENAFGDGAVATVDFYNAMREGASTRTSQVNLFEAKDFLSEQLKKGKDILHLGFAQAISGNYNNFAEAARELNETSANKIYVVDTISQSGGQGLLVTLVQNYAESGKTAEECYRYAEEMKGRICHYFVVDDLRYLARNGRVSNASAFIGNLLKIKPLLYTNDKGKLVPLLKILSRKLSLKKLVDKMKEKYDHASDIVFISHGDCLEEAMSVAEDVKSVFNVSPIILPLDFVIGCHSGPGTIALFFTSKNRINNILT